MTVPKPTDLFPGGYRRVIQAFTLAPERSERLWASILLRLRQNKSPPPDPQRPPAPEREERRPC